MPCFPRNRRKVGMKSSVQNTWGHGHQIEYFWFGLLYHQLVREHPLHTIVHPSRKEHHEAIGNQIEWNQWIEETTLTRERERVVSLCEEVLRLACGRLEWGETWIFLLCSDGGGPQGQCSVPTFLFLGSEGGGSHEHATLLVTFLPCSKGGGPQEHEPTAFCLTSVGPQEQELYYWQSMWELIPNYQ